jgi:hypothetical protein
MLAVCAGPQTARALAAAVIPNEYGISPGGKLRIGSMICSQLLGKLLADLASMREESVQTAGLLHADNSAQVGGEGQATLGGQPVHLPSAQRLFGWPALLELTVSAWPVNVLAA